MRLRRAQATRAFTAVELFLVITAAVILAALLLPALVKAKARSARVGCVNNMKQVGLAFVTWANDQNDCFPMEVSTTNGGTRELVDPGAAFPHFRALSNELNTPKILLCPQDRNRQSANNFIHGLADINVSYFVNVDVVHANSSDVLVGDRNITNRASAGRRFVNLIDGTVIGWNQELHRGWGNLGLADGSVKQVMHPAVALPPDVTHRLAVP